MKNHLNELISRKLVKIRVERKHTQEQIAEALQIRQSSYNRMESGRTRFRVEDLWVLAKFYGVSITYFFRDIYESTGPSEPDPELYKQIEELKQKMDTDRQLYSRIQELVRKLEGKTQMKDESIKT